MKKVYCILIAAVVLVFASCKKYDDDIKRINDRLNRIEGTYISNIDKQIVGINSSLTDLSAVDVAMQKSIDALTAKSNELSDELKNNANADVATKTALENEIADLNALIAALQAGNASLDGKITALQTYVGSELSATEDWATATFATLEQYSSLQTELAAIKALVDNGNTTIDELTQSINDAVAASEQSMKAWVNEQLAAGYYDIATIDAKLSALKGELADADSELSKNIDAQRAALEQAKSYLTAAYKEAIADAIETNNGLFNSTIAESVQAVKDKVDVRLALIDNTIASIQNEINTINSRIATIEQQIVGIVSSLYDFSAVDSALQKTVTDLTAKSNELSEELKNNAAADAATKTALEKEISDLNAFIDALQAGNALLDGKIKALQTYVSNELSATEDWATATFATLEQYASLQTELAAIKALVGNGSGNTSVDELTQAINGAIAASEQSMKAWVNEQLAAGYYDIATIDAKLSALAGELTSSDSELSKDIEAQRAALEQAKSELTAAYKSAIADAIETNNGLLNSTIATAVQTAIDKVETKLAVIDNALAAIQKEIENIKSSIASIQDQITGINASLSDLESVDAAMQNSLAALNAKSAQLSNALNALAADDVEARAAIAAEIAAIEAELSAIETELSYLRANITALQTYVGSELSATEDWATATFATLEQYATLQTELAAIKALVGNGNSNMDELTQAINDAVAASEQSMKAWVNEQLAAGYYDIATIDAKLSALAGELTSSDSELAKDIEAQRAALEQAKSDLTAAYKSAIADAIETNNGLLNSTIATAVQTAIGNVDTKLTGINSALADVQLQINKIANRIQSITYIPQYADGKIKIDYTSKTTELYLRISPAALATSIEKSMVKAFARYTDDPRTRALNEEFNVNVTQVSGNASSGILHICLAEDASNKFSDAFWKGDVEAIIYIQISDGNNDIVSQAVPVVGYSIEPKVDVVTVNGVSFRMVPVKGGTFNMGSTSGDSYEIPVHSVTLSDYAIGETEVTQELWEAVMGTNPSELKGDKKPVESVSWNDCQTFITKLNQLTGGKFRLPTEAEWEFAARGGVKSKGYTYSGSNTIGDVAWYYDNSGSTTHDVATKAANELGIYDMSGNVYEWCQDWYDEYSSSPQNNPTGPSTGSVRMARGGGCVHSASICRSSYRGYHSPSILNENLGMRLAYGDLPEPEPDPVPDENVVTVNGVSFRMVPVKGGTFNMGSTSGYSDEQPVHSVTLSDFAIGKTEVTQELWEAVMGTNPSYYKGDKKPVESVSWDDCQTFITKLNQLTGRKFRLPTEAEWEFAARGGVESKGYTYSGSNTIGDVAWYRENSGPTTNYVAIMVANELGINDMSGNVSEWCQDWYGAYSSSPQNNPTGPSTGSYRVYRGGSCNSAATGCRSYDRYNGTPSDRSGLIGLRLAL